MLGLLTLSGPPTVNLHAATKQYVDGGVDGVTGGLNSKAPLDALAYNGMQINGSMEVSQELGTTGAAIPNGGTVYILDGWVGASFGSQNVGAFQTTSFFPPGFTASFQLGANAGNAAPAANNYCTISQSMEGFRIARLAWGTANAKPITVSFWVYATRTGVYSGAVRNGALNRAYIFQFTVSAALTWEYKTVTIPGDTSGTWAKYKTLGMSIAFTVLTGTTLLTAPNVWTAGNFLGAPGTVNGITTALDQFNITGVTVLPGTYAPTAAQSPLIMRPYGEELETCKRYWEQIYVYNYEWAAVAGAAQVGLLFPFSVEKRAVPTLAYGAGSLGNCSFNAKTLTTKDLLVALNVTAVGHYSLSHQATIDARL